MWYRVDISDDIDDPAERPYLINTIDNSDRLVTQYLDKVDNLKLDEIAEEYCNIYFDF